MSAVSYDGGELFAAGTFSGTMYLDPPPGVPVKNVDSAGLGASAPFLAVLDVTELTPLLLSFDSFPGGAEQFSSPGAPEPFLGQGVYLSAANQNIVLAGGWRNTLDFSTPGNPGGMLMSTNSMLPDIFVAKFGPP